MDLQNQTRFSAFLFRGCIDTERIAASAAVRVTYELIGQELAVADDQPWIVSPEAWQSPCGDMAGDELFYRGGTDLFVFGNAEAPGGRPATSFPVEVRVGDTFRHSILVFGPRVWTRRDGGLVPSRPAPVTRVPLTLEYAFGGVVVWDELPIPFAFNEKGKGYYIDAASALGQPLPQLESAHAPIQRWDERPEPVGVGACPQGFGPKLQRFVEFDPESRWMKKLDARFFNHAFPDMIAGRVRAGDWVHISGVLASGPLSFRVPACALALELQFGEQVSRVPLRIDQLGVDVERRRVFISYRYPFRYRIVPLQKRACTLFSTAPGGQA